MNAKMDLKGDKELIARFQKMGVDVNRVMVAAAEAGGEVVRGQAGRWAPGPEIEKVTKRSGKRKVTIEIGPDEEHWYYVYFETGAAEHGIKPKNRAALKFEAEGDEVFSKFAQHPGMEAQPFLRPALDEREQSAIDAIGRVIRGALPK